MSNEIQYSFLHNATSYVLIRNNVGQIWNNPTSTFTTYTTGSYSGYPVSAAEQGTASSYFTASMPASVPAGSYNVVAKQQTGASPAETDPTVETGSINWNGSTVAQLSDVPTSGTVQPIQMQYGVMVPNYTFYLRSAADHVSPFTSGICSGQISRNGGAFGPLQSGAFSEIANGFYQVTLTSGDLAATTVGLLFTANGVLTGSSDPLPQTFVMQHSSGH